MKAWRLMKHNMELEVLDIDDLTHQVTKTTSLQLRKPMTLTEASQYMRDHYPDDEERKKLINIL